MTNYYKLIQLTNTEIENVATDAFIPFGKVTRRINTPIDCCNTFVMSSSAPDSITVQDAGFYKITYTLTAMAAAAGEISVTLVTNGTDVYTVSQYLAEADNSVTLTFSYTIRVCPNCSAAPTSVPVKVQIQNAGVALTGTSSNIIIEKV